MPRLLLVRHTEVAKRWTGHCYGKLDVGLSRKGRAHITKVIENLAAFPIDLIIHSDLQRTRILALKLSKQRNIPCDTNQMWQERDFGNWEGKSWHHIYKKTGDAMDGMITAPTTFRPGGGETTEDLRTRTLAALKSLPKGKTIAVITHGGPIAAVLGTLGNHPVAHWPKLVPKLGSVQNLGSVQI
jgi:broad specificity phosphatase PhoE